MLRPIGNWIDRFTECSGRAVAWLSLVLALVVCALVIARYAFRISLPAMQEAALYLHATLFMVGAAFTLKSDGHVRVDIFYRRWSPQTRAWVDCIGTLVFLLPVCVLLLMTSWDYVAASWSVRETSSDPGGLPWVWLLKTLLLILPVMLILQGAAELLRRLPVALGRVAES